MGIKLQEVLIIIGLSHQIHAIIPMASSKLNKKASFAVDARVWFSLGPSGVRRILLISRQAKGAETNGNSTQTEKIPQIQNTNGPQ